MDRNEWFKREAEIEEALEERIDELFGEDFLFRMDAIIERGIRIEIKDYLNIDEPSRGDLGGQIAYFRAYRRLKRLRKEEDYRRLLEAAWVVAYKKVGDDPAEEDLMYAAQMIKNHLVELDEFEIRKQLDKRYNGK